jgi:hypothetical protein
VKVKETREVPKKAAETPATATSNAEQRALLKVKELEAQLAKERKSKKPQPPGNGSTSRKQLGFPSQIDHSTIFPFVEEPPKRPLKGASLANPNKKARKVVELEFGDDDD